MKKIISIILVCALIGIGCSQGTSNKDAEATPAAAASESDDRDYPTKNLSEDQKLVTHVMGLLKVQTGKFIYESPKASRPWAGWWIPLKDNNLFTGSNSPLRKYDLLSAIVTGGNSGKVSEKFKMKSEALEILPWEGLCDAWSLASVYEKEPKDFLLVNNICLTPGDQKALLTIAYKDNATDLKNNYFGQLNKKGPGIVFSDIYPDQLHRFIQVELGSRKSPFLMDFDAGEPVWTVPVYRAELNIMQAEDNPGRLNVELYLLFPAFQLNAEEKKLNDIGKLSSPPNKIKYTYSLYGEWQGSDFVVSKGRWTESSTMHHPDYVISLPPNTGALPQGNDETKVDYFTLKKIFSRGTIVESCFNK